jgi:glycosyltransferase involved in cell wall biosynthesis
MSESPIWIDLTELVGNPLRTGIQRVEREIIRSWPGPRPLAGCRFDAVRDRFVTVPNSVLDILSSDANIPGDAERKLLSRHVTRGREIPPAEIVSSLFNPEVFFDPGRATAYERLCRLDRSRISWLIYDFLPFLRPEDYPPGTPRSCMPYVAALSDVPRVSFISKRTQLEYCAYIVRDRGPPGPVFRLGGDGLRMEKQYFQKNKKSFASIGTIEPRKNVATILEAFELLWAKGFDVELILVGRMDSRSIREPAILDRLASEARLTYLGHTDDGGVREVMRRVRATVQLSSAEGFGLTPYESLSVGVPVIVASGFPSMELLPDRGRITLEVLSPSATARAVEQLTDDGVAERLAQEASTLAIPTWRDFTAELADWLQARP